MNIAIVGATGLVGRKIIKLCEEFFDNGPDFQLFASKASEGKTLSINNKDVEIKELEVTVALGLTDPPEGAFTDPRHPKLGWRLYSIDAEKFNQPINWTKLRVDYIIPEYRSELTGESYILEMGFERLNGVDFKKGCYVGQEVTARMKHKTELHKGLVKIGSEQTMVNGEELFLNDKPIGSVLTVYDRSALAYVRLKNRDEILSTKSTKRIFVDKNPIPSN